jgi:aerobic carbon-monoxide dehydrogenase large subunit
MPRTGTSLLGTQVRRVEDRKLLLGQGTFVDNHQDGDVAHAVFVRSPFAHALITGIDTEAAAQAPGVLAVLLAADLGDGPLKSFADVNEDCPRGALAAGKVRFVGDPVALVVAETRAQAVDAAELVDVDYDDLPAVTDVEAAVAEHAPLQFEGLGTNVAVRRRDKNRSDPFGGADHVVRVRMVNQRVAVAPIEGNAILVEPRPRPGHSERVTAWVSTQHPHMSRDLLADALGLEKGDVRVVAPHVGGAFGGKAGIGRDHAAVALAAVRLDRTVKWTETRSEAMLSMHGRGQVQYAELGLTAEGRFVGLRLRVLGECGAYAGFGGALAVGPTYRMAQGVYDLPELRFDGVGVMTNTAPVGAFRGAGRPEAAACLERLVDVAADELALEPEEIRRRNFIARDAFPYKTRTGATYDIGDYDLALTEALRQAGVETLREEQRRRLDAGERRVLGIGLSTYVEITGFGGTEYGQVVVHSDGTVTVRSGTSSHGQGHATSFSMLAADRLGIPLTDVTYEQSDTALIPTGGGTGGSRSLQLGGNAVAKAAEELRVTAVELAARMLEAAPADVELDEGVFHVAGVPGTRVTWPELASYAHEHEGGLTAATDYELPHATYPFGAHVSVVEVDLDTGRVAPLRHVAVDDCGRVLNPLLVAGQQHGGAIQGISQALWEEMVYDDDGQPLTATFADYTLPTAADAISLEASNTETPTSVNPLGAKGIGESATIGATPAVQNAVVDALSHLGVRHIDLPCTPERVWQAINGQGAELWREPPAVFADDPGSDEEPAYVEA